MYTGRGGGLGGRYVGLTTFHLRVPIFLSSGSLNLPEPSEALQACTSIAVPFT